MTPRSKPLLSLILLAALVLLGLTLIICSEALGAAWQHADNWLWLRGW